MNKNVSGYRASGSLTMLCVIVLSSLIMTQCGNGKNEISHNSPRTKTVIDMVGRKVEVPATVTRVSCGDVLAFQTMIILGEIDKITEMGIIHAPWMYQVNPKLKDVRKRIGANLEELLKNNIDVIFMGNDPKGLDKYIAAGVAAIVSQSSGTRRANGDLDDFIASQKEMVRLYGKVLGPSAEKRAEDWCTYYDDKIKFVTARTNNIPEGKRIKTYLVRGPDVLRTHGPSGYTFWYGEMAGANMVVKNKSVPSATGGQSQISIEDLISWDPDVIFVGRQNPLNLVLKDSRLQTIKAVKNKRVYVVPDGVFFWDGGTEVMLLMEYIAKILYPDIFPDLDMTREIKEYYRKFYNYSLTDDEAHKILSGLPPDGIRQNLYNN